MARKTLWAAIVATIFLFVGCTSLPTAVRNVDDAQKYRNQPEFADVEAEAEAASNQAAEEASPEQVVIQLQQNALLMQSEGKWQQAETILQRALRIDVDKVDIYHQLATVRMGQQRFDEAEQIAMKGLTYADQSPAFRASLWDVIAQCRSAQGDIDGANEARAEVLKWTTE